MEKVEVNGENAHPGFEWLRNHKKSKLIGAELPWNFCKFLLDMNGKPLSYYDPKVSFEEIITDVETQLKKKYHPEANYEKPIWEYTDEETKKIPIPEVEETLSDEPGEEGEEE